MRKNLIFLLLVSLATVSFTSLFVTRALAIAPDWVRTATVGGFDVYAGMSDTEVTDLIRQRKAENVSVLEVDSRLSEYMTDQEFAAEVVFLDRVAELAHSEGLKAVMYYPALEVITPNGENIPNTMFKDNPSWVQYGINGSPNVFYGSQEVWVDPQAESAWMSANSPYRDYYLNRIRQLAATDLDGVWVDVPIYLETGAAWSDAGAPAAQAFRNWASANGHGNLDVPTQVNWDDPKFRIWVRWRHENLADFVDAVRQAAQEVDPNFMVIIENFPLDHTDATVAGLDGLFRNSGNNFIRVWEVDSVSNTRGMQWASIEEFSNKIAMFKWGRAADRENPSWSFSYGFQPLDAGLVMAATVATGNVPFESQTPEMTKSVDSDFRTRWFGFIREHAEALFSAKREARVGIWYSSPSRDYTDVKAGGGFGMYITTTPPTNDPDWWASEPGDSALPKPHLGGYRGMAHAMTKLAIPYRIVTEPGDYTAQLSELDVLLLPSVTAISDVAAEAIKDFVRNGGVVVATGEVPGMLDELGDLRSVSAFDSLFNFNPPGVVGERANEFGAGMAFYNPDVRGANLFASVQDPVKAAEDLSTVEQLVRIHAPDMIRVKGPEGVLVEVARPTPLKHYLYVVNYSGLQVPLVQRVEQFNIQYRAPKGYKVEAAVVATPDTDGQSGSLTVGKNAEDWYGFDITVDQFALIELTLAQEAPDAPTSYVPPTIEEPVRAETVQSALNFVRSSMRPNKPAPFGYGIHTNLLNDDGLTEIFAHGHHVALEQVGVMMRTAACLREDTLYDELYEYVRDVMVSRDYQLLNWAVDRDTDLPLISSEGTHWINSNAPLDDFRVIHGLLEGHTKRGRTDTVDLAKAALRGLYWTSVTDRQHGTSLDFPGYPDGLIGYAWDWQGTQDPSQNPPAYHTGIGGLFTDPIPVDYQDLLTMGKAAQLDPRWKRVLASSTDLLLASEIPGASGLFYNGYEASGNWTGDFENRDNNQGKHLKVIQELWTALHLAQVAEFSSSVLDGSRSLLARQAAERSLAFFKAFYQANGRVPEYLTYAGADVPNCTSGNNTPNGCLKRPDQNLINGEARIYALLGRLALVLGDRAFASQLIEEKILTDRVADPSDPRYGVIGVSTASDGDAEIWNIGESLLTICMEAATTLPTAAFTSQCNGFDCGFTDQSSNGVGNIISRSWDFGDGNTSNVQNPSHTYATVGTYAVTLTVTDDTNATATVTHNVTVSGTNQAPTAAFTSACNELACTFNDTSTDSDGNVLTRSWNFGDGNVSTARNPSHTYTTAGSYTVSLTVTDNNGATDSVSQDVTVVALTSATYPSQAVSVTVGRYDWGTLASLTNQDSDTYDAESTQVAGGSAVDWEASTTLSGAVSDVGRLRVRYEGHYSIQGVSQEFFLYNYETDVWELVDTRTVGNETDAVILTEITTNPQRYISSSGEMRARVRGFRAATQNFYVWANYLAWEVGSASGSPTPNQAPTAAFTSACTDLTCNFSDGSSDSDGTIVSWSWDFGDGNASTAQNPSHNYGAVGTFTVSLTVTDNDGATNTVSQSVTVGVLASATYHPQAANVTVGRYDWGTLASFTNQDSDTYDAESVQVAGGSAVDWEASTTLSGTADDVVRLKVRYEGHYSIQGVSQEFFLYNYETNAWELVDTRTVGNETDAVILTEITANPQRYISSSGEMRARVRGFSAATQNYYVWANYLAWEVGSTNGSPQPNQAPTAAFTSACTGLTCSFSDGSSDNDGTIVSWSWDFGDGNTSTAQSPNRVYAAAGSYTVSLTVTDNDGATNNASQSVSVSGTPPPNQAPTAAFTSACTNLTCNFSDGSSDSDGTIVSWSWNFGDGNTSTAQSPSHPYAAAGSYTVSLTVTDNDGATNTASQSVTVSGTPPPNQAPTAAFTSACTDLTCNFSDGSSDSDGNIVSWSWNFGDGNTSTAQSPSHVYAAAGSYTVSLTVTDNDGAANTVSQGVTVGALTSATYHPQAVNVTVGSYDWGTLASFINQDSDTYDADSAQVAGGSAVDWEASATLSGAVGSVGRLKVRYEGHYSIQGVSQEFFLYNYETNAWESVDTSSVGNTTDVVILTEITANPQRYISSSGEMRVRVRGFHATSQNFYVWANYLAWEVGSTSGSPSPNQAPTAAFTSACTDLTCSFTDGSSDSDGTIVSWSWDFGDGNASTEQSPSHNYAAAGSYTVSLTVTDNNGATNTVSQGISVGAVTSATYHPQAVNVTVGRYDWGTLASFTNQDSDTYDADSAQVAGGSAVDWEASATLSGAVGSVGRLAVRYEGHYSIQGVSQEFYLYNYETNAWELVDTRSVGNTDDVVIIAEITANPQRYISSSGEMRVRVRGFHATSQNFYVWANYLTWEVGATN